MAGPIWRWAAKGFRWLLGLWYSIACRVSVSAEQKIMVDAWD